MKAKLKRSCTMYKEQVLGTDCIGSCKSNYHTALEVIWNESLFNDKWTIFQWGDDIRIVLAYYSLQVDIAPLWHIVQILSQPVFALTRWCCVLRLDAANTNYMFFVLIWPGLEPTMYHTQFEHASHYTTGICLLFT